jgi:hypothetical protein
MGCLSEQAQNEHRAGQIGGSRQQGSDGFCLQGSDSFEPSEWYDQSRSKRYDRRGKPGGWRR